MLRGNPILHVDHYAVGPHTDTSRVPVVGVDVPEDEPAPMEQHQDGERATARRGIDADRYVPPGSGQGTVLHLAHFRPQLPPSLIEAPSSVCQGGIGA